MATAVVTGAASGIGRAMAVQLAAGGASLVLADRDRTALETLARELAATALTVDVARLADCVRLADAAGPADLVCLNAGIAGTHAGPVWETPQDEWDRVLDINLGGVINGLRAFVPRLLASGLRSQILITASLAGLATWPGGGAYAASKHAVVAVAEQAALSLAGTDVSVTVLCPALVRSGMSAEGADPADVVLQAFDGVARNAFTVAPPEWAEAIRDRGRRLADGSRPVLPAPSG